LLLSSTDDYTVPSFLLPSSILLADTTLLRTYHRPHSSLYKPHIRVPCFLLDSWTLTMGPISCPETSVRNYHYSPRDNTGEHSSYLLRGGSLKLRHSILASVFSLLAYLSVCH